MGRKGWLVGHLLQVEGMFLYVVQFAAHPVELGHDDGEGLLHIGRQLGRRDAHDKRHIGDVALTGRFVNGFVIRLRVAPRILPLLLIPRVGSHHRGNEARHLDVTHGPASTPPL